MVINERLGFIFVHIPKTGGTSVQSAMMAQAGSRKYPSTKHLLPRDLPDSILADDFRLFAFVRNPWDRFVSLYRYLKKRQAITNLPVAETFDAFVQQLERREPWLMKLHSVRNQTDFTSSGLYFIGRYEKISDDFARLCSMIGVSATLPHLNTSGEKADYRPFYTEESAAVVAGKFQSDIEAFGYSF